MYEICALLLNDGRLLSISSIVCVAKKKVVESLVQTIDFIPLCLFTVRQFWRTHYFTHLCTAFDPDLLLIIGHFINVSANFAHSSQCRFLFPSFSTPHSSSIKSTLEHSVPYYMVSFARKNRWRKCEKYDTKGCDKIYSCWSNINIIHAYTKLTHMTPKKLI